MLKIIEKKRVKSLLIENTLWGDYNKVEEAINTLRENEPQDGYYVAFSGGKDSIVALDLVKKSGVKYDVHYNLTTVEPPELIYFIREHYSEEIIFERPRLSMWQLLEKNKGLMPSFKKRFCCKEFKEKGGRNRKVIVTGVRAAESPRRAKRQKFEKIRNAQGHFLHIIFNWTDGDVWEYIHTLKIPYCKLYDEGFKRIGCILCPLTGKEQIKRDMERFPKIVENYRRAILRGARKLKGNFTPEEWCEKQFRYLLSDKIAKDCTAIPLFSEDDGSVL